MLRLLRTRKARSPAASVPPGALVYAVGDVHGCLLALERLLQSIRADALARGCGDPTIIFLGDVIDRGPDSAGVVVRLLRLAAENPTARFVMGNHEEVFLAALEGDEAAMRSFCRMGGRETALSYGISPAAYERMDFAELCRALGSHVPVEHRQFLASFEDVIVIGDYAFVHAGVRPGRSLADQRTGDLRWIRSSFLDHPSAFEKMVVHGHTICADVDWRSNRIGIDTGAFAGGPLTALGLEGERRWTVQARAGA